MTISQYISQLNNYFKSGISSEHTYRGDLAALLKALSPNITVTNEPKRIACGAPDFIVTKGSVPVGYIEAKDIGADLGSKGYKEQFDRYKKSLNNLIITDYLTFQLFRDGVLAASISIGYIQDGKIKSVPGNYPVLTEIISEFCSYGGQTIKSASRLSKMMAGKARLLADVIEQALTADRSGNNVYDTENTSLQSQYESFKRILIHDITEKGFADIYAQTIAYGMFAARLHDPTLETFTRQEAANLIPKSNPFLRKLFQYIAGYDLDDRIKWIVDALADIFRATDVYELLKDFGKATQQQDPIIHFYETFLTEYDPKLRKSRGVWYTPEPVVNFIVRAVDDILKEDFDLPQGLADTSKTKIKVDHHGKKVEQEVHKVQILDPAAGTGTFLAEIVKHIYQKFEGQQGLWSNYVEDHLIPRLNGFEILMASYAMAHLKLDLLLQEAGYEPKSPKRFRVFLTNSLEEHHPDTGTLFASWLSAEANAADQVKRDTPVMVVLGNPPYSGISTNKGEWITNLIEDYKYVDGEHFGERKHWLQDDYVKFIRYGQHFIDKNGEGILTFINNHSFLDNPTFRGMRWHLLQSFDKIYVLDLHGNTKKKEVTPDGGKDENVFDIQQGVSINIFVKTGKKKKNELGKVFHADKFGLREEKYSFLLNNQIKTLVTTVLNPQKPYFFFVNKSVIGKEQYDTGFKVSWIFKKNVSGIVTMGDKFIITDSSIQLKNRIQNFISGETSEDELNRLYGLGKNYAKFILSNKNEIIFDPRKITRISYRPFDDRFTYFDNKLIWRWRQDVMQNFLKGKNIGFMTCRQCIGSTWQHVNLTKQIADDSRISNRTRERGYIFPLYLYPDPNGQQHINPSTTRTPNLNKEIVDEIAKKLGLRFTPEKEYTEGTFAPIDILDYIYAVLHSPAYREKYKEFLKIDFPRVPYPEDQDTFWQLVKLGGELRQIHLLESPKVEQRITTYPQTGTNLVEKLLYETANDADTGRVWINYEQYFDGVPKISWEFYIGGYQPAQKWLKDRKGRELSFEDILHYQRIIVALIETDRLMKEIGQIEIV